jgi:hypothetical protein
MGWRKSGAFHPPQEILIMTCDVCERDIGNEDGRRPKAHYEISRAPNPGGIEDQDPRVFLCSAVCLRAFASNAPEPERSSVPSRRLTAGH